MEGKGNWDEGTSGVVKTRRKVLLAEGITGVVVVVKMWKGLCIGSPEAPGSITIRQGLASPNAMYLCISRTQSNAIMF